MSKAIAIFTVAVMLLTLIPFFPGTASAAPALHRVPAAATTSQVALLDPAAVRAAATAAGLVSLATVGVPQVNNLGDFLNAGPAAKSMAVVLGKSLFWDQQVGSDGQACASCHFAAGADNRAKNQLNPGFRAVTSDNTFGNAAVAGTGGFPQFRPNYTLTASDFATHQVTEADLENFNHRVIVRSTNDVVSSQGNFKANFTGSVAGQLNDNGTAVADNVFNVGGVNVRRVPPRNTPTNINAVFNVSNFWDGRAHNKFNGISPIGPLDSTATILVNVSGTLTPTAVSIPNSSLASQAVGPPLSTEEMTFAGRTFPDVGKKMLAARPLAFQTVHLNDSALGPFSRAGQAAPNNKGLTFATYTELVQAVFQSKYWDSTNVITFPGGVRTINPAGTPGGYTQAEANFSLFFGLAIQAWESTLVSEKTRFDRFMEGDNAALDQDEMRGLLIFINEGTGPQKLNPIFTGLSQGACTGCHGGPLFSDATFPGGAAVAPIALEIAPVIIDGLLSAAGNEKVLVDEGFYNIGVRPTSDDLGRGGVEAGKPLSFSRQALAGLPFAPAVPSGAPVNPRAAVDGTFKVPSLRNVELTAPYFHNGGTRTLRDVVEFYRRHGDFSDTNIINVDAPLADVLIRPPDFAGRDPDVDRLVRFMLTLTDERVRNEMGPFDHPQISVPNGHPVDGAGAIQFTVVDGVQRANDTLLDVPAVGRDGRQAQALTPMSGFLNNGAVQSIKVLLSPGWNTLSTPVRLHSTSDTLGEFTTLNGLSIQAAYSWNGTIFQLLDATYVLNPLDAIYIQMNAAASPQIIPFEGTSAPPSKALTAGWNLIGAAFLQTEMPVTDALVSAFFAPNTGVNQAVANPLWGYSQVVSPTTNMFDWTYIRGSAVIPNMQVGEGYWVYMVNA
ncbi:MAG: hypothetical protein HY671_01825, partial [Chloroflexi bacterium]|nr:hypothetical protein [Chloroflexota bacterium]